MVYLEDLEQFCASLVQTLTVCEKIQFLRQSVYFSSLSSCLRNAIQQLSEPQQLALMQLIALGQLPCAKWEWSFKQLEELANYLVTLNDFYQELGGITGYQLQVTRLLQKKNESIQEETYHSPFFIDISERTKEVAEAVEVGISALPFLAEMLPLGGAADRLHLVDESTGAELPAAKLEFAGVSLLERIFRDLTARENLYFKRTGISLTTPVAMMTSQEKNNCHHVQEILEKNRWFGRPQETIRSFIQPLVPMVNTVGSWCWKAPWTLFLKPGGHGALWKLAKDHGIFNWLRSLGAKYTLVRQINNPLAGLDEGLLSLVGIGVQRGMDFGFSSCPRICQAAEGVNVLKARGNRYTVSNIEYCDFAKYGIEDLPLDPKKPYSRFTSNTNILFANLSALESAIQSCPFPGLLLNFRKEGDREPMGRLESTMQNISDVFIEEHSTFPHQGLRKVFLTYNLRHKTISPAKKAYRPGQSLNETPEKCFYDLMQAHRDLLTNCSFLLPPEKSLEDTLCSHPAFVFLFHPALGPQFVEIAKKLHKGSLSEGAEFQLELAQAFIHNLSLSGSLLIQAKAPLSARCILRNVLVANRGVAWDRSHPFWRLRLDRTESLQIELKGCSEFIAEDISFLGETRFIVEDGERLIVSQNKIVKEAF